MSAKFEGMVHDLNNVFTTILDTADLLESDPEYASIAGMLHRSVARGRRILEGFSDAPAGLFQLEPVLTSAVEFAGDYLHAKGAEVGFRTSVEPELAINGSGIAWERALFNLLINAGQAIRGQGTVEVRCRRNAGVIEITVADDGPGIQAEVLPQVFERGFSTKGGRSGLGLHIVESIVKEGGGAITAANREGTHGAVFRITVPAGASLSE